MLDAFGIAVSGVGFGLFYGLAARQAGLSVVEVGAMSAIAFGGGAQFAALGYIAVGAPWASIILVTAFINSRHLLYSAALSPFTAGLRLRTRVLMAFVLTDEAFALGISHFRRIGRVDMVGYWIGAVAGDYIPWVAASIVGAALAGSIADPAVFGLDVIFPAAMAGLAVGLVTGRRDLVAALTGAVVGVAIGLLFEPVAGIVAGGIIGPIVGLLVPESKGEPRPEVMVP